MILKYGQKYLSFFYFFLLLALLLPLFLAGIQELKKSEQVDKFEILLKEMNEVIKTSGKEGVRNWAKNNKTRIGGDFIFSFAKWAKKIGAKELIQIAEILASENGDKQSSAYVFILSGEYYSQRSEFDKAIESFKVAETLFNQLNDWEGRGVVYEEIGEIYFFKGENDKALTMYEKALIFFEKVQAPIGKGNVYHGMGQIYSQTDDNAKALVMYEKALSFFEKAQSQIGIGNVYIAEGQIYSRTGENTKALAMYEKALPFFEKAQDLYGQGNTNIYIGEIYFKSGDNAKALEMYEKALPFFEKVQDLYGQGNVFEREGVIYALLGENDKALAIYDKALIFFERVQNFLGQSNIYRKKGDILNRTGENAKAMTMYEKALSYLKMNQVTQNEGLVYIGMGDVYLNTDENEKAVAMYEKALSIFEKAQNPENQGLANIKEGLIYSRTGEITKAISAYTKALVFYEKAQQPLGQGNVYRAMGEIYDTKGENAKALAMYEKALPFFEKVQDPLGQGNVYSSEGDIFSQTNNIRKALAMYDKALSFFWKAKEPIGIGNISTKIGFIYSLIGDKKKSMEIYEKALPFFEKAQDSIGQGNLYLGMGEIYLKMSEYAKALAIFEKALSFYEKAQQRENQGVVYQALGQSYFLLGENAKALAMFDTAISRLTSIGSIENLANVLIKKATVLAIQGKKSEALKLFEIALTNLERVRTNISVPELKKTYFQRMYLHYDNSALFMIENGYIEKGFHVVESMKSRLFLDQLVENLANVEKGLDPALKERENALIGKLSDLTKAIEQIARTSDSVKLTTLKGERDLAQAEFEKLQIEIRLKNPAYALVRYPEPVSLDDLQAKVLKPGEVLIEYYLSTEKAFVFVVTNKSFKTVELPTGSNLIRNNVREYLTWISNPNYNPTEETKRNAAGAILFDQLLKPIEHRFPANATIIIVPDGILAKLPFESLVTGIDPVSKIPAYLLEKYQIKYIQSASVLTFLRLQFKQTGVTDTFIGFGDPVYDYENFSKSMPERGSAQSFKGDLLTEFNKEQFTREGGTLDRLEGSGQEVKEIADLFLVKGKAEQKLRMDASEENAKASSMINYGYIQFSCHGLLGDGYQCLVLSQIPGANEDGFLTLGELMKSSFNAKLVVLSACQTGKGTEELGEGVTGLTRAVMYAGSPASVVSLWSVSDISTKELMVGFYRHMLIDGLAKEQALRTAKLEILKEKSKFKLSNTVEVSISHPFFWAAFVMYGE